MIKSDFLDQETYDRIDRILEGMSVDHATRWCESSMCACLGCANRSCGLAKRNISKRQWQMYWHKKIATKVGGGTGETIE